MKIDRTNPNQGRSENTEATYQRAHIENIARDAAKDVFYRAYSGGSAVDTGGYEMQQIATHVISLIIGMFLGYLWAAVAYGFLPIR